MTDTFKDYNVQCFNCGQVWSALPYSSQWWRAKQRDQAGFLDAVAVSGEECGCVKRIVTPDAPYRIFGYNDLCEEFDWPFSVFTLAVGTYMENARCADLSIWISGVSKSVERRLAELTERQWFGDESPKSAAS